MGARTNQQISTTVRAMSLTATQLAHAVQTASPRVRLMVEALLSSQAAIEGYDLGKVELAYAHRQVKLSLVVSLGCYKFDRETRIS